MLSSSSSSSTPLEVVGKELPLSEWKAFSEGDLSSHVWQEWVQQVDFRSIPKYTALVADENNQTLGVLHLRLLDAVLGNKTAKVINLIDRNPDLASIVIIYFSIGNIIFAPYLSIAREKRFRTQIEQSLHSLGWMRNYNGGSELFLEGFEKTWGKHWQELHRIELYMEFFARELNSFEYSYPSDLRSSMRNSFIGKIIHNVLRKAATTEDYKHTRPELLRHRLAITSLNPFLYECEAIISVIRPFLCRDNNGSMLLIGK